MSLNYSHISVRPVGLNYSPWPLWAGTTVHGPLWACITVHGPTLVGLHYSPWFPVGLDYSHISVHPVWPELQSVAPRGPELQSTAPCGPELQSMAPRWPELQSMAPSSPELQSMAPFGPELQSMGPCGPELQSMGKQNHRPNILSSVSHEATKMRFGDVIEEIDNSAVCSRRRTATFLGFMCRAGRFGGICNTLVGLDI